MISLYHPKSKAVRKLEEGDELRLRLLKRAGFRVGELPPKGKAPPPEENEEMLPSTEGEEAESAGEGKEPVLAKHAPVKALQEDDNPFGEKSMKELRAIAKENEIVIPYAVRTKKAIAALLHSKLDSVDDEGADDEGD
ncbi:hypothetical protein LCGC14_1622820 [marine sediment metagenome]|uniref:Uncharacterized protein n=1 Tax=marine sediment metagenome TaxID=412755 RepID=A0A0F9IS03_9ZZZZ